MQKELRSVLWGIFTLVIKCYLLRIVPLQKKPLRISFGRDIDGISEALFEFKFCSAVMTIQDFHRHLFCFGFLEYLDFLSKRVFPFLFKGLGAVLVFELS